MNTPREQGLGLPILAESGGGGSKRRPSPIVFLNPHRNEVLGPHPRIKWYSLTPLASNLTVELVIRRDDGAQKTLVARYDMGRQNDFLVPEPLPDGAYRIRIRALRGTEGVAVSRWQVVRVAAVDVSNRDRVLCGAAWHRLFLGQDRANPCCNLKEGFGNAYDFEVPGMDPANAPGAIAIREALTQGADTYCSPTCETLQRRSRSPEESRAWYANRLAELGLDPQSEEFQRRLDAFLRGHLFVEGPLQVKISLGSNCNHRCTFCPIGSESYNHWSQEPAVFNYLAANVENIRTLTLTGGEPLGLIRDVSNQFAALFGSESQLQSLKIQTNGALIDRQIELLRHVPKLQLSVSIAGGDRGSYEAIHRRDDFDKVLKNLKLIKGVRDSPGKETKIFLKMVYTKSNYASLPGLIEAAKQIGAVKVMYHHVLYIPGADFDKSEQPRETDALWSDIVAVAAEGQAACDRAGINFEFRPLSGKKIRAGNQYEFADPSVQ